mmetsp:Transcript_19400/g.62175  ORF Transcript_19400/g.62175 Transcript_19400/m.62175 type:complete len:307 (-) Transcript_19400:1826-2746(-)
MIGELVHRLLEGELVDDRFLAVARPGRVCASKAALQNRSSQARSDSIALQELGTSRPGEAVGVAKPAKDGLLDALRPRIGHRSRRDELLFRLPCWVVLVTPQHRRGRRRRGREHVPRGPLGTRGHCEPGGEARASRPGLWPNLHGKRAQALFHLKEACLQVDLRQVNAFLFEEGKQAFVVVAKDRHFAPKLLHFVLRVSGRRLLGCACGRPRRVVGRGAHLLEAAHGWPVRGAGRAEAGEQRLAPMKLALGAALALLRRPDVLDLPLKVDLLLLGPVPELDEALHRVFRLVHRRKVKQDALELGLR